MHYKNGLPAALLALMLLGLAVIASPVAHGATVIVVNNDGPGEGFNDPTPATPVGGNTGTTVGQQRLIAFQHAADLWGARLNSAVPIRVRGQFNPLSCTSNSAVLGSAGPIGVFRDFVGAPLPGTWFPVALANALGGADLDTTQDDINATFNSNIGTSGCLTSSGWYYGLDGNTPSNRINFVIVLLHELGHGLGFLSLVSLGTGEKLLGFNDAYMRNLEHHGASPPDYPSMTNAQRVAASIATGNLHWTGINVRAASGLLAAGRVGDHVQMFAPNPQQSGSSVSHFDTAATPNQLMEPAINADLTQDLNAGLELPLFQDLGWSLLAPTPGLTVTPSTNLSASGPVGGPFSPSSQAYTVSNSGGGTMSWTASSSNTSVATVSPTSGSLGAGAQTTVTVSIAPGATSLGAGSYSSNISFTNTTNGSGNTSRSASLSVTGTATACANNFASATSISGASGTASGSTTSANRETGEPVHFVATSGARSVWCRWVAPSTGQASFNTDGSGFDTVMAVYSGSTLTGLTQIMSDDDSGSGLQSRVSFHAVGGTTYYIAIDGFSSSSHGSYSLAWSHTTSQGAAGLAAAILPYARSVQVGSSATAFATLINASGSAATNCYLQMPAGVAVPGTFQYRTTNALNQLTGSVNTPVGIANNGSQNFVFGFTPSAAFSATDIRVIFDCEDKQPVTSVTGVNSFLLAASSTPTPDLVAIGATPSNDGILRIPSTSGSQAFAVSAVNIGAGGSITATVDDNSQGLPLARFICQTNPGTGQCLSPPTTSVTSTVNANATATYSVFVTASGNVAYNPAQNRLFVRFASGGVTRGATHVAVCTGASCPSGDPLTQAQAASPTGELVAAK